MPRPNLDCYGQCTAKGRQEKDPQLNPKEPPAPHTQCTEFALTKVLIASVLLVLFGAYLLYSASKIIQPYYGAAHAANDGQGKAEERHQRPAERGSITEVLSKQGCG